VKRLRRSEKDYEEGGEPNNHEAQVLKRLNDLEHQNIIRLLATFSYKGHFHMIFPWAKGNLQDFWKNHRLDGPTRAAGHLADWLCQQVIGLTDALTNVHDTQRSRQSVGILSTHSDTRTHGRHGDIKPENILWFDDTGQGADGRSLGVLKLADFGLADFHSEFSKSGANAKGVTGTYQAPEIDVVGVVSQKYDMWSLGCVLMEFVVWYVDGWEGVDNFSKRRSDETASGIRMDNFYDVRSVERATWDRLNPFRKCAGTKYRRATVKPSVAGIQKFLSEDPKTSKACSDFLLDLLDMIQDNLLRMDPDHQAGCDTIVRKIEVISKNCVEDSQYCTQLRRPIRKRHTHRSELCSSENSSYSHRRMDQNSIETDTEGAVASVCEMLTEDANLNERAHLMGDYSSNSSTEHRRHPLQKCFEYISRTLRKCLGFEDGRDS
jgi:serine/threonine protein kinase